MPRGRIADGEWRIARQRGLPPFPIRPLALRLLSKEIAMTALPQTKAKSKPSPAHFRWDDPLLLDEQLSDDERMIRDSARQYAQGKLMPRVIEAYREEKTDRSIFAEMGELGLLGVTIPEEYGGVG